MSKISNNRVICPYCGYRMPIEYSSSANCREITVFCKGRTCRRRFDIIIEDGVQKNLVPNDELVDAFKLMFSDEWQSRIRSIFGVDI